MVPQKALAAVGKEELTRAASLFGAVKALRLRLTNTTDEASINHSFQQHTTSVLEKLEQRLVLIGEHNPMKGVEVIMAKHGLYDAAFSQIVALNSNVSPILGDSLKELRSVHLQFLGDFQNVVGDYINTVNDQKKAFAAEKAATNTLKDECTQLLESVRLLDSEADKHQAEIIELRRKVRLLEQANFELEADLKAERSKGKVKAHYMDTTVPPFNKFLSSSRLTNFVGGSERVNSNSRPTSPKRTTGGLPPPPPPPSSLSPRQSTQPQQTIPQNQQTPPWFYNFRVELQAMLDSGKCRLLNLGECKDLIEKLHAEKAMMERRNKVCETMEMHVYRAMEKKYGLRSLAVEHAGNLMRSLDHHAPADNEISVFLKTFRNEIEEGYRHVAQELRDSIKELIMEQIITKYPTKDRAFLHQQMEKTLSGTLREWNDIIKYLYNGADASALNVVLKRQARDERAALAKTVAGSRSSVDEYLLMSSFSSPTTSTSFSTSSPSTKPSKSTFTRSNSKIPPAPLELTTSAFIKTVLDFQLRAHEGFLLQFRQSFNAVDIDHDGVLTRDEFLVCFKNLRRAERSKGSTASAAKFAKGPAKAKVVIFTGANDERPTSDERDDVAVFAKVIASIDPFETKYITFSQAAAGLAKVSESIVL